MEGDSAPTIPAADVSSGVNGGMTVKECEQMIQKSLRTPMVKFLRENLEKSGCAIGDKFIKAIYCKHEGQWRLRSWRRGKDLFFLSNEFALKYSDCANFENLILPIVVCSNHMNIQDEVNQVVIHELIHAYDDCRAANLDWTNCAHHACSEIRSGHLSGDCHFKRELLRGYLKVRGHGQECVRRRVMKSVTANPHCSEAAAKDAMEAVWDVCYNDTKPFDRAP
ncbi:Mitochondrial inner membrane protease ATP23 [Vitis vinifera]|uniref:Mitochondrial inner membrane protease ATP23 n=1 Tax=Vitis vinifera TaxID=29760 RepID=A0A438G9W2_VITVI|nr:Mitochondrial inner membrane protease ATP23 [Vitis vinifera]